MQGSQGKVVQLGFVPSCPNLSMLGSSDSSNSGRVEKATNTLWSQRSLLSELMLTLEMPSESYEDDSDAGDAYSDAGDVCDEHLALAAPCHCGVGLNYQAHLHAPSCPTSRHKGLGSSHLRRSASTAASDSSLSSPIAIPSTT